MGVWLGGVGVLLGKKPSLTPTHLQAKLRLEMEMERMRQTHSKEMENRDEEVEEARQSCQKKVNQLALTRPVETLVPSSLLYSKNFSRCKLLSCLTSGFHFLYRMALFFSLCDPSTDPC